MLLLHKSYGHVCLIKIGCSGPWEIFYISSSFQCLLATIFLSEEIKTCIIFSTTWMWYNSLNFVGCAESVEADWNLKYEVQAIFCFENECIKYKDLIFLYLIYDPLLSSWFKVFFYCCIVPNAYSFKNDTKIIDKET